MKVNRFAIKESAEIAKKIVEIVAICVAGIWAYYTFGVKDKPALEHRTKVESELFWTEAGTGICEVDFRVSFENIGTTAFNIAKVPLRAWEFPPIKLKDGDIAKYIDVNPITNEFAPFFEKTYDSSSLSEYPTWVPFFGSLSTRSCWEAFLSVCDEKCFRELGSLPA